MEDDFLRRYEEEADLNRKYRILIKERKNLRKKFHEKHGSEDKDEKDEQENEAYAFDTEEFRNFLKEKNKQFKGNLLVFAANDFGGPLGFRPKGKRKDLMNDVRKELLAGKYREDEELNEIREELLDLDDRIHKVLVAVHDGDEISYHVPEGREEETNFLTVREHLGLIDWINNSQTTEQRYHREY